MDTSFSFNHGLGDISNLVRLAALYRRMGYSIGVTATPDKHFAVMAAGAEPVKKPAYHNGWGFPGQALHLTPGNPHGWSGNKPGSNMHLPGLSVNQSREDLWCMYKSQEVQCRELVPQESWDFIDQRIEHWPRPLVLWHSMGNTSPHLKNFSEMHQREFARELLDRTDGTVLILDWDRRVTWTRHNRLRHQWEEFGNLSLSHLAALMYRSQLLVGVDSGPFYFSSLTDIPAVGVYFNQIHPAELMVPWPRALAVTMGDKASRINPSKRFEFQLIEIEDGDMSALADWSVRMLKPLRYLPDWLPVAVDVQLQQIVQQKCKGRGGAGALSDIYDRNRSFDVLLQECRSRFRHPRFVETGCIRSDEDWAGAGFSTALFGRYCQITGGRLTSFDLDQNNVNYAQAWCRQFGEAVDVQCRKGSEGLQRFDDPIDVLYLDSLDSGAAGHQECNLEEFQSAEHRLHDGSLVVIDDTPSPTMGKGAKTLEYAVSQGWRVLYAGYQLVMTRG